MARQDQSIKLLDNASATGAAFQVSGGKYIWVADGAFVTDTLQLQFLSPDGTSWMDFAGASLTVEGAVLVEIANGSTVRVEVTGVSSSALFSTLTSVRE